MSSYVCGSCRSSLLRATSRASRTGTKGSVVRNYSSSASQETQEDPQLQTRRPQPKPRVDVTALLATPSWSVRSLIPDADAPLPPEDEITPKKLRHLLRLSALPLPKNEEEEKSMLATLRSQLHFVRDIQNVNTDGVKPLQSIRDETEEGIKEITITMETLKEAFAKEEVRGRNRRPRRRRNEGNPERVPGVEDWDPLSTAREVVERGGGRYFVVRSGKGPQEESAVAKSEDPEVRPRGTLQESPEKLTKLSRKDERSRKQDQEADAAMSRNLEDSSDTSLNGSPSYVRPLCGSMVSRQIPISISKTPEQIHVNMLKERDGPKPKHASGLKWLRMRREPILSIPRLVGWHDSDEQSSRQKSLDIVRRKVEEKAKKLWLKDGEEQSPSLQTRMEAGETQQSNEEQISRSPIMRFWSEYNEAGVWWLDERQQRLDLEDDEVTASEAHVIIRRIPPVDIRGQGSPEDAGHRTDTQVSLFRKDIAAQITELRGKGPAKIVEKAISKAMYREREPTDEYFGPIDVEEYLGFRKGGGKYRWKAPKEQHFHLKK